MRSCLLLRKWSTSRFRVMVVTQVMKAPRSTSYGLQGAVHLNEDFLGEVLGIVARAGKSIADVVDAPVIALHNFLPRSRIARNTAAYQHGGDLRVFQLALLELLASTRLR